MNKLKHYLKVLIFMAPFTASAAPYFEKTAPPSLADHLHLTRSTDSEDNGWLPNLTGLPDKNHVFATQHVVDVMIKDKDPKCMSLDLRLRRMIFQHFSIYKQMANAQHIYLDDEIENRWAHILAIILKESGGDSTNITDMRGHSISTNKPITNLQQWNQISNLKARGPIPLNYQTNFGLTQISADRLFDAFHLAKDQKYDTSYLEGKEGASTPRKIELNTAIAIRRLIWFYQGFAQGRLVESDERISEEDIGKPEFSARYQEGLNMALLYCGTSLMFSEGNGKSDGNENSELQRAMASIAYCKLGNPQTGYGVSEIEQQCFAKWVTLCPTLNIDIAALTPMSYFATRAASPVCQSSFKKLNDTNPTLSNTGSCGFVNSPA